MEDVLEVYTWPDRDDIRIVCMDEISTQLLIDTREAIPAEASQPKRQDHEYERNGTANIFIGFEPLRGVRFTDVTEQRTRGLGALGQGFGRRALWRCRFDRVGDG